jgi:hypothetical protein
MSDTYLIEAGIDSYLLEDSSGVLAIDQRIEVKASTVGVTEATGKSWLKIFAETVGLTEVSSKVTGFVKIATQSILGLTDALTTKISEFEYQIEGTEDAYELEDGTGIYLQDYPLKVKNEVFGITEASAPIKGLLEIIASTIGLTDINNKVFGFFKVVTQSIVSFEQALNKIITEVNFYLLEDGTGNYINEDGTNGRYQLDQIVILKFISSTLGLTEVNQRVRGILENINDTLKITEASNRARVMLRNFAAEVVGVIDTINRLGVLKRNLASTVGITETQNRLGVVIRNIASTLGLTEVSQRLKGLSRTFSNTVGITGSNNLITGIVKIISDIVGFTELNNKIRSVFVSFNAGTFIASAGISLSNFISMASNNIDESTVINSINSGEFTIVDDD